MLAHGGKTVVVAVLEVDKTLLEDFLEWQVSLLSPELFALTWRAELRQDGRSRAGRVNFRFRPFAGVRLRVRV